MRRIFDRLRAAIDDRRGNAAIIFSLALLPLAGGAGMAVDYAAIASNRAKLQAAADAGALHAAKELRLAQMAGSNITTIAKTYAQTALADRARMLSNLVIDATLIDNNTGVQVKISAAYQPVVFRFISKGAVNIGAQAVGRTVGFPICALALDEAALGAATLYLEANAKVTAQFCAVQSNSKNPIGITALNSSKLTAGSICSSGGVFGPKANFLPDPVVDCPIVPDPLASRAAPVVGACTYTGQVINGGTMVFTPGVYCGGLKITGGATVTLSPGEYVIKDGPFIVENGSTLKSLNAGVYLTGTNATVNLAGDTTINMTAPVAGPMAGLLFFEDRAAPKYRLHKFTSDNAPNLLGTIYLPQGQIIVDANKPIADQSAFTIIVARRIALMAGPNLVLNSDYNSTNVPVPGGLNGSHTYLTR